MYSVGITNAPLRLGALTSTGVPANNLDAAETTPAILPVHCPWNCRHPKTPARPAHSFIPPSRQTHAAASRCSTARARRDSSAAPSHYLADLHSVRTSKTLSEAPLHCGSDQDDALMCDAQIILAHSCVTIGTVGTIMGFPHESPDMGS